MVTAHDPGALWHQQAGADRDPAAAIRGDTMFTRRIAALAAALLTAFTVAAATTGGTAAASPLHSATVQAAGPGCPTIVCWRLPESPQACLLKFPPLVTRRLGPSGPGGLPPMLRVVTVRQLGGSYQPMLPWRSQWRRRRCGRGAEVCELGYDGSYPSFTRARRGRGLRPRCEQWAAAAVPAEFAMIEHPPGSGRAPAPARGGRLPARSPPHTGGNSAR
jgi:hypothetical protein